MNAMTQTHQAPVARNAPVVDASIGTLVQTTERLADVLQQETDLLRRMDLKAAAEVQVEKATLAEFYEKSVRELRSGDGVTVATIPVRDQAALRRASARLNEASTDNERALRAVRQVNERVLAAIVDAAREQTSATHSYGARGSSRGGALSLTVDRQL